MVLWQLKEKIPFIILSAVVVVITFYAPGKQETSLISYSLGSRAYQRASCFWTYLGKTFWPHDLTVFYPFSDNLPAGHAFRSRHCDFSYQRFCHFSCKTFAVFISRMVVVHITILAGYRINSDFQHQHHIRCRSYHYLPSARPCHYAGLGLSPFYSNVKTAGKKNFVPVTMVSCSYGSLDMANNVVTGKTASVLFIRALKVTKKIIWHHVKFRQCFG